MMLQDLSRYKEAIRFLVKALNCYEVLYGPNDIQTAAMYGNPLFHSNYLSFLIPFLYSVYGYLVIMR